MLIKRDERYQRDVINLNVTLLSEIRVYTLIKLQARMNFFNSTKINAENSSQYQQNPRHKYQRNTETHIYKAH